MSEDGGFDKEAERERLREKYERDRQKRERSERMSELLLQGATMTNRHCGDCGDPIFRYDGQEFCPTCQKPVGAADEQAEEAEQAEGAEQAAPQADEMATIDIDDDPRERTQSGEQDDSPEQAQPPEQAQSADRTPTEAGAEADASAPDRSRQANGQAAEPSRPAETGRRSAPTGGAEADRASAGTGAGDLAAAESSLVRTVEKFARGAEESGDLGRARDYLAAAREAAEALEAVRRAE
ncbi:MAG: Sjogren's syndrome/scleroderma autoantigen 1 family protein [Haloarculaceae archaeon]